MEFLTYTDAPAVIDVYTPCRPEHGIAEASSNARARLAVESRMNPVFVHDPRRGTTCTTGSRSTATRTRTRPGRPPRSNTSTTTAQLQLMTMPLTPAHFALGEIRFKKQFRKLPPTR